MKEESQNFDHPDDITLEDIVITTTRFIQDAKKKWWIFALMFLLIGGYKFYKVYTTPPTYQATFTFMRDEDESGGFSSVASILGQFGLGGSRSKFNLDRVLELAKSRRVVQNTIFETVVLRGNSDFLGNHIISIYDLDQEWKNERPDLEGFRLTSKDVQEFSDLELIALKKVYNFIVGGEKKEGLVSAEYSEESTILSLYAITIDESLSIVLITELFDHLAGYYIAKSTEKQKVTYSIVKSKADSIGRRLAQYELEYAEFKDANQNLYSNIARLNEDRLIRDIQKLNFIHGEALKNVEIADFSLRNATPVIRELDTPIRPLDPVRESIVRVVTVSFVLSMLMGLVVILGLQLLVRIQRITNKIE
jgi:hypothetical protein